MNNALKTTATGPDSAGRPALSADPAAGKRTLTESLGESSAQAAPSAAPALSAIAGDVASSFASSGSDVAGQVGSSLPTVQRKSAADVAEGGFAGGGHEVPHRAQMEQSFGMDFSNVRAHSGGPATKANDTLGSHAYAMGNQVAFKSANPSPSLVAHELTHVVQQTQSPSFKADGAVDTSGEAEANAVESAVAAGKPASSALRSVTPGSGPGLKAIGAGPALRKRGPALEGGEGGGSKFGMGMTFSLEGFEKSYDYTIWKGHYAWPIGIPGINFVVDPNVKVSGKGAVKFGGEAKGDLSAQLGVFGECGVGLSGGIPDVAEIYGTINPGIEGAFTLTKHGESAKEGGHEGGETAHAEGGPAPAAEKGPKSTWSLVGAIGLKAAAKIGVSLAGGIVDQAFELGSIEICKLTGIYFDQTGFRSDKLGFEWSEKIKATFDAIKRTIDKAKNMGKAAIKAAKDAGGAIAKKAGEFGHWVTSW
ncbi:MAG TPA: DUF4157 domain-containing protein [Kofleriaceae bacterium]|jgi:hypothetical protein|nr:DUF4157 domain-containing protein [Kofleriaceae bacterium]